MKQILIGKRIDIIGSGFVFLSIKNKQYGFFE